MGDRFYKQQLEKTGSCPGSRKKRKRMSSWTEEMKLEAVSMYEAAEPTPETSMEVVKQIAEDLEQSPNGVRMVLTKAGVYIKKTPEKKEGGAAGGTRVSKEAAQNALKDAITDAGQAVDEDIVSKLTGKAAVYFTSILTALEK